MSQSKAAQAARLVKLRRKLSDAEVIVTGLREQIAKLEGEAVVPDPETDLAALWEAAPDMARTRSSPFKCKVAWKRIPKAERPTMETAIAALQAWKRDPEWRKDAGQFVPALDRWIRERRWENAPQQTVAPSRARLPQKDISQDGPGVTDPAEVARLLGRDPRRMQS